MSENTDNIELCSSAPEKQEEISKPISKAEEYKESKEEIEPKEHNLSLERIKQEEENDQKFGEGNKMGKIDTNNIVKLEANDKNFDFKEKASSENNSIKDLELRIQGILLQFILL